MLNTKTETIIRNIYKYGLAIFLLIVFVLFCLIKNTNIILMSSFFIILLSLFVGLMTKKAEKYNCKNLNSIKICIVLFFLSFLIKIIYCIYVNPVMIQASDFSLTLQEASEGVFLDRIEYYRKYLHKLIYPWMLNSLGINTQMRIYYFQCILVSFVPVFLYKIGEKIMSSRMGIYAAILYILWPSHFFYVSVISEEHVAVLIITILFYEYICFFESLLDRYNTNEKERIKQIIITALIIGLLSGIATLFKDYAIILLVAALICSIYIFILNYKKKYKIVIIISFLIFLIARAMIQYAGGSLSDMKLGVSSIKGVITVQMYESLDPDSTGTYNKALHDEYYEMLKNNNYDYKKTNKSAMDILLNKIVNNPNKMSQLILRKGRLAYETEDSMLYWVFKEELLEDKRIELNKQISFIYIFNTIYYVAIVLLIVFVGFTNKNKFIFFILLSIFGGVTSHLLIEAQTRYGYSIKPIWCIVASYGVITISDYMNIYKRLCRKEISNNTTN